MKYPPLAEECCLDGVMPNGPGGQWKPEAIERFVTTVEDDGECLMMVNDDRPEGAPEYPLKVDLLCRFKEFSNDRCEYNQIHLMDYRHAMVQFGCWFRLLSVQS